MVPLWYIGKWSTHAASI